MREVGSRVAVPICVGGGCPSRALKLPLTFVGKALNVKGHFNAPLRLSGLVRQVLLILRTSRTLPSFSGAGGASDPDEYRGLLPFYLRPLALTVIGWREGGVRVD